MKTTIVNGYTVVDNGKNWSVCINGKNRVGRMSYIERITRPTLTVEIMTDSNFYSVKSTRDNYGYVRLTKQLDVIGDETIESINIIDSTKKYIDCRFELQFHGIKVWAE